MKKQLLFLSSLFLVGNTFSQVVLSEDFESGLPGTWTQTTLASDGGWLGGTASSLSSSNFPISTTNTSKIVGTNDDGCNCNKSADRLVSPSMNLTSVANYRLSVDVFFAKGTYQSKTETGTIEISTDGGTNWTVLRDLTANSSWRNEMIDLASYAGNNDVKISFNYNDDGGWLFGYAIDNFVVDVPQADNAMLTSTNINRYGLISTNQTLSLTVLNYGSNAITSLEVSWNDGVDHTQTITTNIAPGATATVNHPDVVTDAVANTHDIAVTITQVNGNTDPDMSNNNGNTVITFVSQIPTKNVVIEEGTGTWCQWCPRGAVAMDYMYTNYPNQFIGIAVHNNDPMEVSAYDAGANFSGFPSANVDRVVLDGNVGQSAFENYYNARKDLVTPASVDATVTASGASVTIDVTATFFSNFSSSNYRLGVIIVEDDVTGTSSGYNQANAYSGGGNGAMGGYESLPNPVPAAQMVYNHVGRALLGGYNGQTGSIPAAITDGQVVNYSFNYTVPTSSDISNMFAVPVIIDNDNGEIINASKVMLYNNVGVNNVKTIEINVFPNPATDKLTVSFEAEGGDYSIDVTDLQGRTVLTKTLSNLSGSQVVELNTSELKTGNYLVSIAQNGGSFTKMITIK